MVVIANHAVHASTDYNKEYDPRVVGIDLSALGTFSSASWLAVDKNTDLAHGPTAAPVCPAAHLTIQQGGYGMAFPKLIP